MATFCPCCAAVQATAWCEYNSETPLASSRSRNDAGKSPGNGAVIASRAASSPRYASSSPWSKSSHCATPRAMSPMVALAHRGASFARLRTDPLNLIRLVPAKGVDLTVPRCLTIAGSDSGGGAGIQADLKAFAAAGCFGTSAIVALTAQNTLGVTAVQELPPGFVEAELEAVFSDIGVDAAKTGMLFSRELIDTVADFLAVHPAPLVVDPVMVASSGAKLLQDDAVASLVDRLFPIASVVTPNLMEAEALAGAGT